ncbi:uncharacterized protein LOC128741181 [Sabethes cyaneus]|uniref:uncharacterized protein LOC128741181 n=1 Tax=Sabethes cyaneus TaxID=53552 RepID=UPI00237EB3A4|nr:uncharacterized protein LOC128741181 [Sabethes cyaneus]
MQLMTLNSLLMFDIVFIFFLFLVGVTCLVYYLPPPSLSAIRGSKGAACSGGGGSQAGLNVVRTTSGTTTTCTGETVRFRRYSVGSLLSAADVAVGNHRFHAPAVTGAEELVADCSLEEILSLRGSPILVPSPIELQQQQQQQQLCACCLEHQQLLQQIEREQQQHHLVENPYDIGLAAALQSQASTAAAVGEVDYVQIEIERTGPDPIPPCCYVRAKDADIKECHGPIHDV